jgi:hypothetical protein
VIVVDVGCAHHPPEESIQRLVDRYRPQLLFGLDPLVIPNLTRIGEALVVLMREAAWTEYGTVPYIADGIRSRVTRSAPFDYWVPCVDLAAFLEPLTTADQVVLKLDCEGAEYPLLEHLAAHEIDRRLELVLVEWHEDPALHGFAIEYGPARPELRCPVEEWVL